MSLRNDIALFEYAYLVSEESGITPIPHEVEAISPLAFRYLKEMALGSGQDNRLFRLCQKTRCRSTAGTKLCRGDLHP